MRVAIYFTPASDNELTRRAVTWLGRDAFTGRQAPAPHPQWVSKPARYGFHATLRAPFCLRDPYTLSEINKALAHFSARHQSLDIGPLKPARIDGFFALVPFLPVPALKALEAAVRIEFDPFRAELSEIDIARRNPENLSDRQRFNLRRWGYPHVDDDFRFHMTLTGQVSEHEAADAGAALDRAFGDILTVPVVIQALSLFVEPAPGEPLRVHAYHPLQARHDARTEIAPQN